MDNPSFLSQVAQFYAGETNLADYCFVFPNKRSRQFFFKELQHRLTRTTMLPRVCDLQEFVASLTHAVTIAGNEALFTLYDAYRQVFADKAGSFDHFVYWGDIILNDFNDVDRDLVDTRQLYTNLSNLRDIATDYIDDELKQEIRRIFNINLAPSGDRFWKNEGTWKDSVTDSEVKNQYFTLWEGMQRLYETFHETLAQRGLTTTGRMMRDAVTAIADMAPGQLPHERIVVVGFAMLSMSEIKIFKSLQSKQVAHFWWDNADAMLHDANNPGGKLIQTYAKMFPAPAALLPISHDDRRQIRAIKVPSYVGMAKFATHEVERLIDRHAIADPDNAIDTAIVLPDEGLTVPLINSLPAQIKRLNITLGYPLRNSNIVSLMRIVARAHKQATRDGVSGRSVYYREDVRDLLSHPIVKSAFGTVAMRLSMLIERERKFNVDAAIFDDTPLQPVMASVPDTACSDDVIAYVDRLIAFTRHMQEITTRRDAGDDQAASLPLQAAFMAQYATVLGQLRQSLVRHGVPMTDPTLFYLIDRMTATPVVPFTGEPLQGLQVMGVLETRNLDFDNLIVLSMNERVFPRRHTISSFIPNDLRRAFFMSTHEQQEALSTYYFYRMIARARNVSFIYDSSTQALGSSEPSRFITQLEKIYRLPISHITAQTQVSPTTELAIEVAKTPDMIAPYTPSGDRYLSASSINEFINCPLRFYLHGIQRLNDDTDSGDFMDYGTFGTIVHDSLQELYYPTGTRGSHHVTRQMILDFEHKRLRPTVVANINRTYMHRADPDAVLQGDAFILLDAIMAYVKGVLHHDLELIPAPDDYINVLECECQHNIDCLTLPGDGRGFRFTFKADRVDRVHTDGLDGPLRIIDYKTGTDSTRCNAVEDMFDSLSGSKRPKAMLQLMLYCNAYQHLHPECGSIMPMIYQLHSMSESGMKIGKEQYIFTPDDPVNATFSKLMHEVIGRLLDPRQPFTQTPDTGHCRFCRFTDLCRR